MSYVQRFTFATFQFLSKYFNLASQRRVLPYKHLFACQNNVFITHMLTKTYAYYRMFRSKMGLIVMNGKRVGYVRVSTPEQNPDRQLEGIVIDKKFIDYASAKDTNRPNLQNMLNFVREGDHVMVHSIDRFARNLRDLEYLVDLLISKGVSIQFLTENLLFDGQINSSLSKLLMQMMGAFAEFERKLVHERQAEGIRIAKSKGKYAGRTPSLITEQIKEAKKMHDLGVPKVKIAKHFKCSRFTIHKYLKSIKG